MAADRNPLLGQGRIIAFHRAYVDLSGSITGALLLSQALYWQGVCKAEDGFWWKTHADWEEETGMTRKVLDNARAACARWLQTQLRGSPPRMFWRLDADTLSADLGKLAAGKAAPDGGSGGQNCPDGANRFVPKGQIELPERDKLNCPKRANSLITEITGRDDVHRSRSGGDGGDGQKEWGDGGEEAAQAAPQRAAGKRQPTAQPIAPDWTPSARCYELCEQAGIPQAFAARLIGEFILYWEGEGTRRASWDATFFNNAERQWKRAQADAARRNSRFDADGLGTGTGIGKKNPPRATNNHGAGLNRTLSNSNDTGNHHAKQQHEAAVANFAHLVGAK